MLSFYSFAAASIAYVLSAICYVVYAVGRVRVRRTALATGSGPTIVGASASLPTRARTTAVPGPDGRPTPPAAVPCRR